MVTKLKPEEATMDVAIDERTVGRQEYLSSWEEGT